MRSGRAGQFLGQHAPQRPGPCGKLRPPHPEHLQSRLIELGVRLLGGDRVGEVLELMEEFEEAVCVSFHVFNFRQATASAPGQEPKAAVCAECDGLYPERARPKSRPGHDPGPGGEWTLAAQERGVRTAEQALVTTKRSIVSSVNGAVPTTIIVAGLALAGYALLMTALNRRVGLGLLAALGVLEILLLVLVGIVVARLIGGGRPASLGTLIGYLIAMPLVPVIAGFWGAMERSRWGPAVYAVAGLVAAVLMVRLHEIWPAIHV